MPSPKQNIWVNLALSLTVFILIFAVLEISARIVIAKRYGKADAGLHWKYNYEPYVITKINDIFKQQYPPKSAKIRLVIIGGSAAQSLVNELFEQELRDKFAVNAEVINLSQGGHISNQELIILTLYGISLQPDIIISIDGSNDIMSAMKSRTPSVPYTNTYAELAMNRPFANFFFGIIRNSQFANAINKFKQRPREISAMQDSALWEAILDNYLNMLNSAAVIAKGLEAKYLIVLQPYIEFKTPLTEAERNLPGRKSHFYRLKFVSKLLNRMKRRIETHSFPGETVFLDGSEAFENCAQNYFCDEVHLYDDGRAYLVDYICQKLHDLNWIKPE